MIVLVDFRCVAGSVMGALGRLQLRDQIANLWVRLKPGIAAQPHADLGTVVAAENRPVLHQRHPQSFPGRRHRRTHAGNAAADHHKIKLTPVFNFRWLTPRVAGHEDGVLSEQDRITPAFKAG